MLPPGLHHIPSVCGGSGIPKFVVNPSNPPNLAIDFTHNQAWTPSGGTIPASSMLTTVRASVGYANDNSGNWTQFGNNVPRITNLGLLVEETRTNLFLNSAVPATQIVTVVNTSTYAVSVIGTGALVLSGALSATVTQGSPFIGAASTTSLTVTTSGITGTFINAQVELGASVTSPIVTAGTSATRAADVVKLTTPPVFGTAYSLYGAGTPQTSTAYSLGQFLLQIDDGTNTNRTFNRRESATANATFRGIGGTGYNLSAQPQAQNVLMKIGGGAAVSDQAAYSTGGISIGTATAASLPPSPNTVRFGSEATGILQFDGFISYVAIWATQRVPNAQLQAMT